MSLFRRKPAAAPVPTDLPGRSPLVRLEGASKEAIETGRNRLVIGGMLFGVAFALLAGRLVQLTLMPEAEPRVARVVPLEPPEKAPLDRRAIVDRNGAMVATNIRAASLFANPRQVLDAREAAHKLVGVLPEFAAVDLQAKLSSGRSFEWIKRGLTPREQHEVNRLGIPGLYFQYEQKRAYPQRELTAHVVGLTDRDGKGIAGVEQHFDALLRDPADGAPLSLSIDLRVQHAVRDELLRAKAEFNAIGAGGLVMNVHTGEVVALVSLPDFDPLNPGDALRDERLNNRITLGVYEMGSTMKTLNTAMALDAGIGLGARFDASAPLRMAGFAIRDERGKNRWLSVAEILVYSSNIGSARMALDIGAAGQRAFLEKMGFLRRTSIELPETGAPLVPRQWKQVETATISFGHGLSVTPLHLGVAMAAVVNGGVLHPPTLVKRDPGVPPPGQQVISPRTSEAMRRLLRLIVEEGTAKKAAAPGYLVGGKTGTAEKVKKGGGYDRKANLTTFASAFPMTAPRYVVITMLDEPKGTKATHNFATAGWNAAPTTSRIIGRIAPMLGVPPVDEQSTEVRGAMFVSAFPVPERKLASH